MKILTRSLVRHAHAIAREVGARVIMLYADVVEEDRDLSDLIQDVDFRVILVSRHAEFRAPRGMGRALRGRPRARHHDDPGRADQGGHAGRRGARAWSTSGTGSSA